MDSDEYMMSSIRSSNSPPNAKFFNFLSHVKFEHFVAGISGGVASTLILHPLDLIKIRFAGMYFFSYLHFYLHSFFNLLIEAINH